MASFVEPLEARIAPATLTISAPASINEGNSGATNVVFTVSLSDPAPAGGVTVHFNTADGTATTADNDYTATSLDLTFDEGQTVKTVQVPVKGDTAYEANEHFSGQLSNAVGATIDVASASTTITNDDLVKVSITGGSVVEGNSGDKTVTFTISLDHPAPDNLVSVHFNTGLAGDTASASNDYDAKSVTIPFLEGETSKTVSVTVHGDTRFEGDEYFTGVLSSPTGAVLDANASKATMTIQDDDPSPKITISDGTFKEGASGTSTATFTVTLDAISDKPVTISYLTHDGTATVADNDYVAKTGTLTIPAGQTTGTISVTLNGDKKLEADETFKLELNTPVNGHFESGDSLTVTGTIQNDESVVSISSPSILEGHSGNSVMKFTVSVTDHGANPVTVDYATADAIGLPLAVAGADYDPVNGTLTFAPGQNSAEISVTIHGDIQQESSEAFRMKLSNAHNAVLAGDGIGIGTIRNDDPVINPIENVVAGAGQTGATVDLGNIMDPSLAVASRYHTFVEFKTNYVDPAHPNVPQSIIIELYDNLTPQTVSNFLSYVNNRSAAGDYDGVFFHRLISDFVLQAGGFSASNPSAHIPTGPQLVNEFSTAWPGYADSSSTDRINATSTDDLKVNVRGTIAMAKTATSPDSATSEFFFNLGDNSTNLDFQNGGFTVFGKVTDESLHVLDAIAKLPTKNLSTIEKNGALTDVPVQNGYVAGAPTGKQLVQITDAHVIAAPHDGVSEGYHFSVTDVTDAATGAASDLVTAKLTGDKLDLKFKPGASGVVKVHVMVIPDDGSEPIPQEFSVTVKPNLVGGDVSTSLHGIVVPGDTGLATLKITNTGVSTKAAVDVKFYLSQVGTLDPLGTILDPSTDALIGSVLGKTINFAGGKSVTIPAKVQIPQELFASQSGQYRIIAQVTLADGSTVSELFTNDNTAFTKSAHRGFNGFGNFGDGNNRSMTFVDHAGDNDPANDRLVTLKLAGGKGYGELFVNSGSNGSTIDLALKDTTASSSVSAQIVSGAGHLALNNILIGKPSSNLDAADPIGTVAFGNVDVLGNFTAYGGLKSLTLGNLTPRADATSHTIGIGSSAGMEKAQPVVRLGSVADTNLVSWLPVASLTADAWLNSGGAPSGSAGHETIDVAGLKSLAVKGDLAADVKVRGTGTVGGFTVGGTLKGSDVYILGNASAVSLGAMSGSSFIVGDDNSGHTLASTVARFSIKGAAGAVDLMADSLVKAERFGSVYVQSVDEDSGTEAGFGFVAHAIKSYQRGVTRIANLIAGADPQQNIVDPAGNYRVTLV